MISMDFIIIFGSNKVNKMPFIQKTKTFNVFSDYILANKLFVDFIMKKNISFNSYLTYDKNIFHTN